MRAGDWSGVVVSAAASALPFAISAAAAIVSVEISTPLAAASDSSAEPELVFETAVVMATGCAVIAAVVIETTFGLVRGTSFSDESDESIAGFPLVSGLVLPFSLRKLPCFSNRLLSCESELFLVKWAVGKANLEVWRFGGSAGAALLRMPEFSRFSLAALSDGLSVDFSRRKFDVLRASVEPVRFTPDGSRFVEVGFLRYSGFGGSLVDGRLDVDGFASVFGFPVTSFLVPVRGLVVLRLLLDRDTGLPTDPGAGALNDSPGLGSREFAREVAVEFARETFRLAVAPEFRLPSAVETGILVGDMLKSAGMVVGLVCGVLRGFVGVPSSCSESLFGVPMIGDSGVGRDIRLLERETFVDRPPPLPPPATIPKSMG